jgi:putative transposase
VQSGDRDRFLEILSNVADRFRWRVYAFCLMENHYHLVVEQRTEGMSRGMQYLNGVYAQTFNRRHGHDGHLFQGRFHAVLVESDWHLLELARYLALNPVRAGLCRSPGDWPWSSYGLLAKKRPVPPFLVADILRHFGTNSERARESFEAFVQDAPPAVRGQLSHGRGSDPETRPV